jgi:anaerobic ribonucleoside-triphosphate reductase activating protein
VVADSLAVHAFVPATRANGPGLRACLWLQGCSLGCPGCFNPETHDNTAGHQVPVSEILGWIDDLGDEIDGITISGGEPLQQWEGLVDLLEGLGRRHSCSVVLFSGFSHEEIDRMGRLPQLTAVVDVLVAGRYREDMRLARGLRGSHNKTVHLLSDRYTEADIDASPVSEVLIDASGGIVITGMEPIRW